jgi:hypothetical protein
MFLTSNRRIPVKKYVGLSAVVCCVCDLSLLFSVVFNLVGAVLQYVFEHVVTRTGYQMATSRAEIDAVSGTYVFDMTYMSCPHG